MANTFLPPAQISFPRLYFAYPLHRGALVRIVPLFPATGRFPRRRAHRLGIPALFGYAPRQIQVYLLNPLKTLYFQGISPILCSNLMCFPLFLPLRAETRESFLLSADHLIQQSCGSTLRFPCSVSVNIHCGTDIGVSEKLLHILRRCPV